MKKSAIITLLILSLIIAAATLFISQNSLSATIEAEIAPADAKLTLNGRQVDEGLIKVKPGEHRIIVSRNGFETFSDKINVPKGQTRYIGIVLRSNSPNTADWYETHPQDAKIAEGITSKMFDQATQDKVKSLPILKELPWIDRLFRVDYGRSQSNPSDPNAIALYVTYYSDEGKTQALDWLKFKGHTPDSIEMIFTKAD